MVSHLKIEYKQDFIHGHCLCRCPIFKWGTVTCQRWGGTRMVTPAMATRWYASLRSTGWHHNSILCSGMKPGGSLNMKMSSYQYRDPHVNDKTVLSLTWESPYLVKMVFILRWGPVLWARWHSDTASLLTHIQTTIHSHLQQCLPGQTGKLPKFSESNINGLANTLKLCHVCANSSI